MALSDAFCRAVKPQEKVKKYSDAGGLFLLVDPRGGKYWRLAYSFGGKQKTLAIGVYPAVGLADARHARDDAKRLLRQNVDPGAQKKLDKLAATEAAGNTFELVAVSLRKKMIAEGRAAGTMERHDRMIATASKSIGKRPISEVTSAEVQAILARCVERGKLATAQKLRVAIGMVFRHGIVTGKASNDPTVALQRALPKPPENHRAAILEPKEFGALLRAIWSYQGQPETRIALQLLALLYPRPGELRTARWCDFDLEDATWAIPKEIAKTRRPHKKPLPKQAVAILRELWSLTGDPDRPDALLFPSQRSINRPMSDMTTNAALRRMGFTRDEVTSHGFRASASTMLNETGLFSSDAIERELAHIEANAVRRAYQRADFWSERVEMARWWADRCDELRLGKKPEKGHLSAVPELSEKIFSE